MNATASKWTKLLTGAIKFLPEAQWVGIVVELLTQLASSMGATSGDSKEALKHIEALRGDLGQVTAAHAGLAQQLDAKLSSQAETLVLHSEKLDALSAELHLTRLAAGSIELRLATLEARSGRLFYLLVILLLLISAALILLILVFLRLRSAS